MFLPKYIYIQQYACSFVFRAKRRVIPLYQMMSI